MLMEFAWDTFEKTGNVDYYMFFKEVEESNKRINDHKTTVDEVAASNSLREAVLA